MAVLAASTVRAQEFGDYGKPGKEHKQLAALVGKWELEADGVKEKGTAEFKSILGGRFVQEESRLPFGQFSMEWVGLYGYDTQKKKYTAVWVDNMDTTTETGEADAETTGKVFSFKGQHTDPRTGKPAGFVWRITLEGDSKLAIEMFEADASGKEQKVMTVRGVKLK
jgi:hypothetical protein